MLALARRYGGEMPITEQIVAVRHHGVAARDVLIARMACTSDLDQRFMMTTSAVT